MGTMSVCLCHAGAVPYVIVELLEDVNRPVAERSESYCGVYIIQGG